MTCPWVSVAGGNGPYANTRAALARLDLAGFAGRRVLLKPNAGRMAEPGSGVITHPEVVAATADAFREIGADIAIGESPIIGIKTMEAFEITGLANIARNRNIPLIDMDERKPVILDIPGGRAISSLKVCADVLDFDTVVSIPVMKTHMHTVATLSLKNMKGCLWRRSKVDLHMLPPVPGLDEKPLNVAIADMATVLMPDFTVIDGTVGLEGLGPSAGTPKPMDVVVAGSEPVACDAVTATLMGITPKDIPHLRMTAERTHHNVEVDDLKVEPQNWRQWIESFERVPENVAIKFPGADIHDEQSCSACQSTLMLFLKRYGNDMFQYFTGEDPVHFAIGKGHEKLPAQTVCVGNCTRQHRDTGIYISGCPPVASSILNALKEKGRSQ